MGIDLHIADYWASFHAPVLVLVALAVVVLVVWKLYPILVAALRG